MLLELEKNKKFPCGNSRRKENETGLTHSSSSLFRDEQHAQSMPLAIKLLTKHCVFFLLGALDMKDLS